MLRAGGSEKQGMLGLKTSHQILAKISNMFFLCHTQMFDGKQTAPAEKPRLKNPQLTFCGRGKKKKKRTQSAVSSSIIKGRNPNPICCRLLSDLHHMYTVSSQGRDEKRNPRKTKLVPLQTEKMGRADAQALHPCPDLNRLKIWPWGIP